MRGVAAARYCSETRLRDGAPGRRLGRDSQPGRLLRGLRLLVRQGGGEHCRTWLSETHESSCSRESPGNRCYSFSSTAVVAMTTPARSLPSCGSEDAVDAEGSEDAGFAVPAG